MTRKKVLLIEDELGTAAQLRQGLSEHGFGVDVTHDGAEGLAMAAHFTYDLVILDVLLPGLDGWSVLAGMRVAGNQTPVLVLSALGSVECKTRGLGLGADDYLTKPFELAELLARADSILRRVSAARPLEWLLVADLEIDLIRRKATRQGRRLDLTPKEFKLLLLLARYPGQVFSRTAIAELIWESSFDGDSNFVDVHVRRLRSKLDDPFDRKLLVTVRGLGYAIQS